MKKFILIMFAFTASFFINADAQWQKTSGPFTGTVSNLAVGNSSVFASSYYMYRSTDNGLSWQKKSEGIWQGYVNAIIVSEGVVFAGTSYNNDGYLFYSTDNGETWTQNNTITTSSVYDFAKIGSTLFMCTYGDGMYKSLDNGMTWSKPSTSGALTNGYCFSSSGNNLYIGTFGSGILRSTDDGSSWISCGSPGNLELTFALAAHNNVVIAACASWSGYGLKTFRSTDFGSTWVSYDIPSGVMNFYVDGNNIYAASESGIYKTTNDGITWMRIGFDGVLTESVIVSGGNIIAGMNEPGIFTTSNGGANWINTGTSPDVQVNALCSYNDVLISNSTSYQYGLFTSRDNGLSFSEFVNLSSSTVNSFDTRGSDIYAGSSATNTGAGGIYKSTDTGLSWDRIGLAGEDIYSIKIKNNFIFTGSYSRGVFRTSNDGAAWNQMNNGLQDLNIKSFAVIDSTIYAATGSGVYSSANNGSLWTLKGLQGKYINELTTIGNQLFAATGSGVYLLELSGNWSGVGLDGQNVTCIKAINSNLAAGTYTGISISTNSGTDWIPKNQGLGADGINRLAFNSSYIFAGTMNNGIWRRSIADIMEVKQISSSVPSSYFLYQNYPNPFNPSTRIRYEVKSSGVVTLKVFDLMGREVETLVNEKQSAGTYEAEFNGLNFSSGVYFYKMQAGNFVETKRMLLIK